MWRFGLTKTIELGPILNISQMGLMVQYIDSQERRRGCNELSIAVHPYGIQVERIRFETVADFEVASLPDEKAIRNRSVRFVNVTSYQAFQMETFIKLFAKEALPDRRSLQNRRAKVDASESGVDWDGENDRRWGYDRRE